MAKLLLQVHKKFKYEDFGFVSAFLARYNTQIKMNPSCDRQKLLERCYDEIHLLEIEEQWQLAKGNQLEQMFSMLEALHKHTRNQDIVFNKRFEEMSTLTAIIDPNKFPIFSLIDQGFLEDIVSLWDYRPEVREKVKQELGFMLSVRKSTLEHFESGSGVLLELSDKGSQLPMGTLLGFVPGVLFDCYKDYVSYYRSSDRHEDQYLQRYNDLLLDFELKIPYPYVYGLSYEDYGTWLLHNSVKEQSAIYHV